MITVAIFNMFAVFFAFLAGSRRDKFWLKVSFVVIFLFLALRYDYGNDYDAYLQGFLNIISLTLQVLVLLNPHTMRRGGYSYVTYLNPLAFLQWLRY